MYGRFKDGVFELAPSFLHIGKAYVFNPTEKQYRQKGYKPMVYTKDPEAPEGYTYESDWEEQDDSIVQVWNLVELPSCDEVTAEEIAQALEGIL